MSYRGLVLVVVEQFPDTLLDGALVGLDEATRCAQHDGQGLEEVTQLILQPLTLLLPLLQIIYVDINNNLNQWGI